MKNLIPLIVILLAVITKPSIAIELTPLTNKEGKVIQVTLESYDPDENVVGFRLNGQGSVINYSLDLLDEASQQAVHTWNLEDAIKRFLRFETKRIPGEQKNHSCYEIKIWSSANVKIKDLRIKYQIPCKTRVEVATTTKTQKKTNNKNKNKNNNNRYNSKTTVDKSDFEHIVDGEILVGTLAPRSEKIAYTEEIETDNSKSGGGKTKSGGNSKSKTT
jgi:hypothetical protein